MAKKIFTVDLEDYFHAIEETSNWSKYERRIEEPTNYLLARLREHGIKAVFYVLGHVAGEHKSLVRRIKKHGHLIGSHGMFHTHNERQDDESDYLAQHFIKKAVGWERFGYRSPYWDTTPMPGFSGGFFFRALPLWLFKIFLDKSGVFWIHPHDIDEGHPKIRDPLLNLKRHYGLRGVRSKLERLLTEVRFEDPETL